MLRSPSPLLFLLLNACTDWTPPEREPSTTGPGGIQLAEATASAGTDWPFPERGPPEIDPLPPPGPGSTSTTASSSSGQTSEDSGTGVGRPLVDLSALVIAEVLPDPAGKDGGPASPEFVEVLHVGAAPTELDGLEIVARAWPVLDADELGLAGHTLLPGQRLTVLRYAVAADVVEPLVVDEHGITVAFAHEDGLRNADGGVLLRADGVAGDMVIFGAAQPAPWDSPEAWVGPPVDAPTDGVALCRIAGEDHDAAGDFAACAPSPGEAGAPEGGTTGDGTTGDGTTGDGTTGPGLPAEVVIVEVLSNPPGPGNQEKTAEFVELLNLGPGSVDLAGWTIADAVADDADGIDPVLYLEGDGGCAPATCLAPGNRAIVVGNAYAGPKGPGLVLVTDDTTLANAGLAVHEPVVMRDADSEVRSTYRVWPDPLVAPDPALTEESLVREPVAVDAPESWSFAVPTPGE